MGIRFPLQEVLDVQNNGLIGAASVAGGIANTFVIPQDTDNIVLKMTASTAGAGVSTIVQTSDDGGTTWYDVARTSIISNAVNENAQWLNIGVNGLGFRTTVIGQTSVAGQTNTTVVLNTTGSAAASALGVAGQTGLPILGPLGRTFLVVAAAVTGVASVRTQVYVNSQSGRV